MTNDECICFQKKPLREKNGAENVTKIRLKELTNVVPQVMLRLNVGLYMHFILTV